MGNKKDLCERLLKFAVDVILYLRTVKNSIETMDMKRQLVKSLHPVEQIMKSPKVLQHDQMQRQK